MYKREKNPFPSESRSASANVIDDLGIGNRSRVLHDGTTDRIDPLLLLLLGVGEEVHGVLVGGKLEGAGLVEDVFGALDSEAGAYGDDATRGGGSGDVGALEPEELALFEDKPAAAPGLDVLALLGKPAGALGVRPELDAAVVLRTRVLARRRSPEVLHFLLCLLHLNETNKFLELSVLFGIVN